MYFLNTQMNQTLVIFTYIDYIYIRFLYIFWHAVKNVR